MIYQVKDDTETKGGGDIQESILISQYQIIRLLGKGRNGSVYLAYHPELQIYRALKVSEKKASGKTDLLKEAKLLSNLHHPGIPKFFGLEKAFFSKDETICLIEEYIEGYHLLDLIKYQGHLYQEAVVDIGLQLCSLIHYLHSAEPFPILYLDLQPKNVMYHSGKITLIDFDHAETVETANQSGIRYGTKYFCAPEQEQGKSINYTTDIYQIGAILSYLWTGNTKGKYPKNELADIIDTCLQKDYRKRYSSVKELETRLRSVSFREAFKNQQRSSFTAAILGIGPNSGTEILALGMAKFLCAQGIPAVYESFDRKQIGEYGVRWDGQVFRLSGQIKNGVCMGDFPVWILDLASLELPDLLERCQVVWILTEQGETMLQEGLRRMKRYPQGILLLKEDIPKSETDMECLSSEQEEFFRKMWIRSWQLVEK